MIDIHYSDFGGTNNINFSFITRFSIPVPEDLPIGLHAPALAFSADGSKFAMASHSRMSVWDIRSKVPLKTFMDLPNSKYCDLHVLHLQFSSGKLGKEVLVFVQVCLMFKFSDPYLK